MKHIKVLGTGCANCKATIEMIRNEAETAGIDITLEKVEDMAAIVAAGILSTPGVLVNNKVVHAGGMPSKSQVKSWLASCESE